MLSIKGQGSGPIGGHPGGKRAIISVAPTMNINVTEDRPRCREICVLK